MNAPILMLLITLSARSGMTRVGPGMSQPLYAEPGEGTRGEGRRPVPAFELDRHAVTNAAFLAFVKAHPAWRRDQIPRLFADEGYLWGWRSPTALGADTPARAPVVHVSWFAARAYCEARGEELPTEDQWELAAAADATRIDARDDPSFIEEIIGWYGRPTPKRLPNVALGRLNVWGVYDLHGLIWEWVLDFASTAAAGASVSCGGGASATGAKLDYAGFMRSAFRSSLQASYTTGNLGFRCARTLKRSTP